MSLIDSRAIVDPKAKLADNVKVGPWSIIGPDVEIDLHLACSPWMSPTKNIHLCF